MFINNIEVHNIIRRRQVEQHRKGKRANQTPTLNYEVSLLLCSKVTNQLFLMAIACY